MKRFSILMIFVLLFSMLSISVCAENLNFSATYDASSELITLRGNGIGIITVRVTDADFNSSDLSDDTLPIDYHQFNANGSFVDEFYLPYGTPNGTYELYITDSDSYATKKIVVYSKSEADAVIKSEINNSSSEQDFINSVTQNALALGINTNDEDFDNDALRLMYSLGTTYKDSADFYNEYQLCTAVNSLSDKSGDEVLSKLNQYSSVLSISVADDYENNSNLTDSAKKALLKSLSQSDYIKDVDVSQDLTDSEDFRAVYLAYCAYSAINDTQSWQKLRDIYTKDFDFLKENVVNQNKDYSKLSSSDVFAELVSMKFDKLSDIEDNFDRAVDNVKNGKKAQGGSSSGGGGGGGWSVPSVTDSTPVYDETPGFTEKIKTELSVPLLSGVKSAYTDVAEADWYAEAVTVLGGSEIISGDPSGAYRPNDNITRAEFAKLIVSAFNIKAEKSGFRDVATDSWYEPYVTVAAGAGIIQGYDGYFSPDSPITRQDAAVIIYRTADLLGAAYVGYKEPADIGTASVYAWPAIVTLYHNGVINGVGDNKFMPLDNISRAQAAQLIYNVINNMSSK